MTMKFYISQVTKFVISVDHLKLVFFIVFRWNANSWSYACMVCILGRNVVTYYIKPIKTYKCDTMHKSDIIDPKTILIRSFQSALLAIEPTSLYNYISKDSNKS
jgi:hypothetical protein